MRRTEPFIDLRVGAEVTVGELEREPLRDGGPKEVLREERSALNFDGAKCGRDAVDDDTRGRQSSAGFASSRGAICVAAVGKDRNCEIAFAERSVARVAARQGCA